MRVKVRVAPGKNQSFPLIRAETLPERWQEVLQPPAIAARPAVDVAAVVSEMGHVAENARANNCLVAVEFVEAWMRRLAPAEEADESGQKTNPGATQATHP